MPRSELPQIAHLLRRAGFGASREELDRYAAKGYEATVEELLHPEDAPPGLEYEDLIRRYRPDYAHRLLSVMVQPYWSYRMVHSRRPLEEKIALLWHGIFATAQSKVAHSMALAAQIDMFRRYGLSSFHTLLLRLSKDPAMIFWLDGADNHAQAVNENYGRELLELFSMGVGNYTEHDVRECGRAFTGWTMLNFGYEKARSERCSAWPYGRTDWLFQYRDEDHDHDEKSFLGHVGRYNGEDVIDIICRQPATARFVARHLYNFFVADEVPVPGWNIVPPLDPGAIEVLSEAFVKHDYVIRDVLRVLFNSDFFKKATRAKVKSPAEFVAEAARIAGGSRLPQVEDERINTKTMGQLLLNPPSVEGWHTGVGWINTAALMQRINFACKELSDPTKPGIKLIIDSIRAQGREVSPGTAVDICLDLMGPLEVSGSTRGELVEAVREGGPLRFGSEGEDHDTSERIVGLLSLIAGSREYQFV